jgi:hypothetical protein
MATVQAFEVGDGVRVLQTWGARLSGEKGIVCKLAGGPPGYVYVHVLHHGLFWLPDDALESL